jgi:hypothetical protein
MRILEVLANHLVRGGGYPKYMLFLHGITYYTKYVETFLDKVSSIIAQVKIACIIDYTDLICHGYHIQAKLFLFNKWNRYILCGKGTCDLISKCQL